MIERNELEVRGKRLDFLHHFINELNLILDVFEFEKFEVSKLYVLWMIDFSFGPFCGEVEATLIVNHWIALFIALFNLFVERFKLLPEILFSFWVVYFGGFCELQTSAFFLFSNEKGCWWSYLFVFSVNFRLILLSLSCSLVYHGGNIHQPFPYF